MLLLLILQHLLDISVLMIALLHHRGPINN
jgi:hypothetical protein